MDGFRKKMFWKYLLFVLFLGFIKVQPSLSAPPIPIRFLHPNRTLSPDFQSELTQIISEYNAKNPIAQVQLINRGTDFSSLRELIAMYFSENPPEIAAIEASEIASLDKLKLTQSVKIQNINALYKTAHPHSLPFERTGMILIANEEELFHAHLKADRLPRKWAEILPLSKILVPQTQTPNRFSLALPLQSPRGLWVFESLAQRPLWNRETGGLRSNRELAEKIHQIQMILDTPKTARTEENWDRAIRSFLDRKTALLLTSTDMIPYLTLNCSFRWLATPLQDLSLQMGSDLVLPQKDPEKLKHTLHFIKYLYSPAVASRWAKAGGFIPLSSQWITHSNWKSPASWQKNNTDLERFHKIIAQIKLITHRQQDPEIVRIRTAWVQALHLLFGDSSVRQPIETVLSQLDRQLGDTP